MVAWATVIHQSCLRDGQGIKLKDLAASMRNTTSILPALRLLWDRWMYPGTTHKHRDHYESVTAVSNMELAF